ncbi:hypothetical protein V6O07_12880, partial [Arthrospira platensis SPKY2]
LPLDAPGDEAIRLVDSWDGRSSYLGTVGDTVYVSTNIGAPRGRIVAIDLARPAQAHWRDVVGESAMPIEDASLIGDEFIVHYLDDAKSRVERFALDGHPRGPLPLPGIGRVSGFTGSPESTETFFLFQGFDNPGT